PSGRLSAARLAAPARSAGSRLPEKTVVAHRACGAERLAARLRREAADEPGQRRVANLARGQRRERHGRVVQRAERGGSLRLFARRRCRQRADGEPGRHERRDDPEETSICRHGPTLSHLTAIAIFWPLASLSPSVKRATASW